MAKFKVYLDTDLVNSRVEREFEIPDDELDGLSDESRNTLIREYAQDEVWHLFDWGYEEVGASTAAPEAAVKDGLGKRYLRSLTS
jgi:hypothetical protein